MLGSPSRNDRAEDHDVLDGVCPFCLQAERYLKARGVADIDYLRVDLDPELRRKMMERTGRRTVPQIYIDAFHVGGYEDLVALDRAGGLLPLLAGGKE